MKDSLIINFLSKRYRDIIKQRQSRGMRIQRMRNMERDILLAYEDKPMPAEVKRILNDVEAQIC